MSAPKLLYAPIRQSEVAASQVTAIDLRPDVTTEGDSPPSARAPMSWVRANLHNRMTSVKL